MPQHKGGKKGNRHAQNTKRHDRKYKGQENQTILNKKRREEREERKHQQAVARKKD